MTQQDNTKNLRLSSITEVANPVEMTAKYPMTDAAIATVREAREETHKIIHGEDDRLVIVVGPCSIHDPKAALEYAEKLTALRDELKDQLQIVMRVYFEKPRTSIGWKGLINDPDLTGEFNINKGLETARELLLTLADQGMPAATEYLDLITPQYISDLVAWAAVGARTTESQGHRELASGVSCPIGFKNGTYGNVDIAVNAIKAASKSHTFLSMTEEGHSGIFTTTGNEDCHIILRGGKETNYDAGNVAAAVADLEKAGLPANLMVDFSHANSSKDFRNQPKVADDVAKQIAGGSMSISGIMIESHLVEGRQDGEGKTLDEITYGQSITDACISWETTETVLRQLADAVEARRNK